MSKSNWCLCVLSELPEAIRLLQQHHSKGFGDLGRMGGEVPLLLVHQFCLGKRTSGGKLTELPVSPRAEAVEGGLQLLPELVVLKGLCSFAQHPSASCLTIKETLWSQVTRER